MALTVEGRVFPDRKAFHKRYDNLAGSDETPDPIALRCVAIQFGNLRRLVAWIKRNERKGM
ncbi:hypothetical protein BM613_02815 [Sulfoacidibacillus thermotolerans]|uniref:Uncharacterized protein n=1 Tax=Sulfoacidibacillus thermotolerans TaxID=1765684 RepID=A0A2U3DB38_SULT2|nr:hypothetical protein BM613_02815 [Sulfoacidibacillus thermotolerans]